MTVLQYLPLIWKNTIFIEDEFHFKLTHVYISIHVYFMRLWYILMYG